ncbi:hypothetical protein EVAR_9644_1 [Eumeta japonica]|uniref:Uncharacterized protein n=1 Tax=Eumeta variegata TaxID=151549 RepID=A0A4C1TJP8_EUMVA|nr:hypothetical protein EVAR_9644_1 [Eumeta japonica]
MGWGTAVKNRKRTCAMPNDCRALIPFRESDEEKILSRPARTVRPSVNEFELFKKLDNSFNAAPHLLIHLNNKVTQTDTDWDMCGIHM